MTELPAPGTELCALDELPDGSGRVFSWGIGKRAFGVVVLRQGDRVTAYVNRCPHFSIPLDYRAKVTMFRQFVLCSHHYAAFRTSDGYCVEGPCEGAALQAVALTVEGGIISIAREPQG